MTPTQLQIVQRTLEIGRAEVGVKEIGNSNRGTRVDEYQRADLLPGVGYSWCASFEAWRMLMALGRELCDAVWLRSASCDELLQWGRREKIVSDAPAPGSMGLVMASKNDATHVFHADEVLPDAVISIEGNTNTDGSRNGNGVYRRRRVLSSRYLWLHWWKRLPLGAALPGHVAAPAPVVLPPSPFAHCPSLKLLLGGKVAMSDAPILHGRTWVPAWKWAEWMNASLAWDMMTQSVLIDGREVSAQPLLIEGRAWLPVMKLAAHNGLKATFDGANHRVEVTR